MVKHGKTCVNNCHLYVILLLSWPSNRTSLDYVHDHPPPRGPLKDSRVATLGFMGLQRKTIFPIGLLMKCPVASSATARGFNVNEIYISLYSRGGRGRSRNIEIDKAKELFCRRRFFSRAQTTGQFHQNFISSF